MSTSPISSAPDSLFAVLIAAQLVGAGGSAGVTTSPAGDAAALSDQAIAMLEAEQSALAMSMTALSS